MYCIRFLLYRYLKMDINVEKYGNIEKIGYCVLHIKIMQTSANRLFLGLLGR